MYYIYRPWWHILIPFAERPPGDGLQWNFYNHDECNQDDVYNHDDVKEPTFKTCSVKLS